MLVTNVFKFVCLDMVAGIYTSNNMELHLSILKTKLHQLLLVSINHDNSFPSRKPSACFLSYDIKNYVVVSSQMIEVCKGSGEPSPRNMIAALQIKLSHVSTPALSENPFLSTPCAGAACHRIMGWK